MPVIQGGFKPKNPIFKNPHVSTIYASLLRWVPRIRYKRERIFIPQGDFLDLDWSLSGKTRKDRLILILAGLEGKSSSLYARSAVRYFNQQGWDAVCMNYRGCSGEPNWLLEGYHMGQTGDVRCTIHHILEKYNYSEIHLIGYSLGGNLALKYLGEEGSNLPEAVKGSVSFSVPMDIKQSNERLGKAYNWHYLKWFMMPLNYKANRKKKQYPDALKSYKGFFMSGNFVYFDTHFTAPANGFSGVEEYWRLSSCKFFLSRIRVPSLIVHALDDTFLSDDCIPYKEASEHPCIYLETNKYGGHCGFISHFWEKNGWMEKRALEFMTSSTRFGHSKEVSLLTPEMK